MKRYAREAASLREAPPSRSLPKSGWRLAGLFLHRWFRLRVWLFPIGLVEVTAADRAAATVRRLISLLAYKWGPEGVAGAIGKLPDGLRPPPRFRRDESLPRPQTRPPKRLPPQRELSVEG